MDNKNIYEQITEAHESVYNALDTIGEAKTASGIALSLLNQLISNLDLDEVEPNSKSMFCFTKNHSQMSNLASAVRDYLIKTDELLESVA